MSPYVYVIIAVIVIFIIVYIYRTYYVKTAPLSSGWISATTREPGWSTSPDMEIFHPIGSESNPYGVFMVSKGKYIELKAPSPLPEYWEYDIYSYPSMDLVHSIPMQITSIVGNTTYPLKPGRYLVLMKIKSFEHPSMWAERGSALLVNKDKSIPKSIVPEINDVDRYDQIAGIVKKISTDLSEEGFYLKNTLKSSERKMVPLSPYIRHEYIRARVEEGEYILVIASNRNVQSSLIFNINNTEFKVPPEDTLYYALYSAENKQTVIVSETIYGVKESSDVLPLYMYIFVRE